jgi:tetratricopeptide (TPR) repeat protein
VLAALGLALEKLERKEQAIETYQRALTRNEKHEGAQAGLKRLTD